MAFTLQYNPCSYLHTIRGLLGKDGQLYWISTDLITILSVYHLRKFSKTRDNRKVRDVSGIINFGKCLECKRIFNTEELIQILSEKYICHKLIHFLKNERTPVQVVLNRDIRDFKCPSKILISNHKNPYSIPWITWFETFKKEVENKVYMQNANLALNFVKSSTIDQPQEEEIPRIISMYWQNQTLSYVLYDNEELTESFPDSQPQHIFISLKGRILPYVPPKSITK